eukprot:TRINITY_DN32034_c1_g5_i1.p1 TRINITY_DN32034_c1_g5~~TRINITY_DN32034_c1_g5_i1.p1  ORF type:complete len:109 (+),score=0.02 TRINITY_DN32034_c1_g5_i1:22-327(+)
MQNLLLRNLKSNFCKNLFTQNYFHNTAVILNQQGYQNNLVVSYQYPLKLKTHKAAKKRFKMTKKSRKPFCNPKQVKYRPKKHPENCNATSIFRKLLPYGST